MKPRPLREALQSAVNQRNASLYNDRCHRKDINALRASIGRAEVFLRSFPVAETARFILEAETSSIALVIFFVFLTDLIRRLMSSDPAI